MVLPEDRALSEKDAIRRVEARVPDRFRAKKHVETNMGLASASIGAE
jgi:hypothetical protein